MTQTQSKVDELLARMGGKVLVIDPVTDADETAAAVEVRPMDFGGALRCEVITDPELIRALYDHPSAESYGDGSYTVAPLRVFVPSVKLTGYAAITYAEYSGQLTLNKYADPIEDAREGLSVEEARKIALEDPALIWIEAR